jgi:hypothetical protein
VANKSPHAATDPNGPTGWFATWLANTTLDDAPSVDERANHSLLDGVACALVGAQLPVSRKGVEGINSVTRLIDRCGSNEVRHSHQSQGPGGQTLNLGMLFSAKCKVRINLCAMVRSISL